VSDDETPQEKKTTITVPAAVHTDRLWDGPRYIENASAEPVYIETKKEYWDHLAKHGMRMKGQQESDPGPHYDPAPAAPETLPPLERREFTRREAEVILASKAFRQKYGIKETVHCNRCFARKLSVWLAKVHVTNKKFGVICQCGVALYNPEGGMTNEGMNRFANSSATSDNLGMGVLTSQFGGRMVPVTAIERDEASLVRAYWSVMQNFDYDLRWFCGNCFDGSQDEDDSMGVRITPTSVAVACANFCRMLAYGRDDGSGAGLLH